MTVYVTGDIHSGLDMQKLRDWELGVALPAMTTSSSPATLAFRGAFLPRNALTSLGSSRAPTRFFSWMATTSASTTGRSVPWSRGTAG